MTGLFVGEFSISRESTSLSLQQICHLDRSAAEWRDLRFSLRPREDTVTGGVPRDEGSPALVVAGVVALVLAWLAARDVAQQPVAVAGVRAVLAAGPADAAVLPAGVAVPAPGVSVAVAGVRVVPAAGLADAAGLPAGVAVPAAAVPAVPAEEPATARLGWVAAPAGQCVPLVPVFLLEGGAMVRERAADAAVPPAPGLVHAARREEADSLLLSAAARG
jgi:hypothetical protein